MPCTSIHSPPPAIAYTALTCVVAASLQLNSDLRYTRRPVGDHFALCHPLHPSFVIACGCPSASTCVLSTTFPPERVITSTAEAFAAGTTQTTVGADRPTARMSVPAGVQQPSHA